MGRCWVGTELRNGYPVIRPLHGLDAASAEIDKLRGQQVIVVRYSQYEIEPFAARLKIRCLGHTNIEETMEGGTLIEVLNEDR